MNGLSRFILTLLVGWSFVAGAHAVQLAGSGDRLKFMQKIQGSWLRDCRKIVLEGQTLFEQTRLKISYTELVFSTTHYRNADCFLEQGQYETRYPYNLGEPVKSADHKKVYELNLGAPQPSSPVFKLPLSNIIRFEEGELLLGKRVVGDTNSRLTELDYQNPFYRY